MYYDCPYFDSLESCTEDYLSEYSNDMSYGFRSAHQNYSEMRSKKNFTKEEAIDIAKHLNIKFDKFDVEQFRIGLVVELEHGTVNMYTNITNDDPILTGKITLAHLNEFPDYYTRLTKMEKEADEYWDNQD